MQGVFYCPKALAQKLLGKVGAGLGVLAVVIGTNVLGVAGSQHRAAYHDFAIQLGSVQGLDGGLHVGHGGGHQGRKTDQLGTGLAHGFHHALRRHITTQIQHIVTVVFEDDAHDVFADVVHIAFDGGNDDLALAALGLAGGGNLGLDSLECGLGSRGGLQ